MADPFAFRNQRRQERQDAQDAAIAGGGNRKKKPRNPGGGGGGKGNGGKGDQNGQNDNELDSNTNNQTWNEQPLTYLQFLGGQGGLTGESGGFNNYANMLYSDIENQYNNDIKTYKNNDLDFTDWLKRQDQYGNPNVGGANKQVDVKNADDFSEYVRRKYYEASDRQRGLDRISYGAGSTRWSAF